MKINEFGKLLKPEEYTFEILAHIQEIKNKMDSTLVEYSDSDILVFEYAESIYILANPIVRKEYIYDVCGKYVTTEKIYNITLIYEDGLKTRQQEDKLIFTMILPRLRIIRPELCKRIDKRNES